MIERTSPVPGGVRRARWRSTDRCQAERSQGCPCPQTPRRRPRARATSGGSRPRAPVRTSSPPSGDPAFLGHHDDVAGLQEEVLGLPVRGDDLVIVERNSLHGRAVEPEDEDARARREVAERASLSEHVQPGGPALELVPSRGLDFTDHGPFKAPNLSYADGDSRRRHVLRYLL